MNAHTAPPILLLLTRQETVDMHNALVNIIWNCFDHRDWVGFSEVNMDSEAAGKLSVLYSVMMHWIHWIHCTQDQLTYFGNLVWHVTTRHQEDIKRMVCCRRGDDGGSRRGECVCVLVTRLCEHIHHGHGHAVSRRFSAYHGLICKFKHTYQYIKNFYTTTALLMQTFK